MSTLMFTNKTDIVQEAENMCLWYQYYCNWIPCQSKVESSILYIDITILTSHIFPFIVIFLVSVKWWTLSQWNRYVTLHIAALV